MTSDGAVRTWLGLYVSLLNKAPVLVPEHITIPAVLTLSQIALATPLAAGPSTAL
jgi:hypothetical protein